MMFTSPRPSMEFLSIISCSLDYFDETILTTDHNQGIHNINKLLSQENRLIKDTNYPSILVKTQ